MPRRRKKPTEAEMKEASRILAKLRLCKIVYPTQFGVFCRKTRTGPFYLAHLSKKYVGLKEKIPELRREGYRGCFIVNLQDACVPEGHKYQNWLDVKTWKKKGN